MTTQLVLSQIHQLDDKIHNINQDTQEILQILKKKKA